MQKDQIKRRHVFSVIPRFKLKKKSKNKHPISILLFKPWRNLCRVYTYRFDNQVTNEKLIKKYFLFVKLEQ